MTTSESDPSFAFFVFEKSFSSKVFWAARSLRNADGATHEDLREAVTTLEETARAARRVFGGAHPLTAQIERRLPEARAVLGAREGDDVSALRAALDAMTATM